MNIALVGYGKMGKAIEEIAHNRQHEIVAIFDSKNSLSKDKIQAADVAIDFSTPKIAFSNISFLINNNIPSVVGTTGWNDYLEEVTQLVKKNNGQLVHASNFSVGVNLFFKLNEFLAQLMAPYDEYRPKITEIHHTGKLDAPSGTAITLGKGLIKNQPRFKDWYCPQSKRKEAVEGALEIEAIREADVKGTHKIDYQSTIDSISIQHKAFSRVGFALGAVIAAEWLQNKKGIFTMRDVLQLS